MSYVQGPQCDPFVTTRQISSFMVDKVFIDTGSGPDVMYIGVFRHMEIHHSALKPYDKEIYGFNGSVVKPLGILTLLVMFGNEHKYVNEVVDFLVVNMNARYNVVLGRSTLCKIGAVVSQPHLCMKFPTHEGVGIVTADQEMARQCYLTDWNTMDAERANQIKKEEEEEEKENKEAEEKKENEEKGPDPYKDKMKGVMMQMESLQVGERLVKKKEEGEETYLPKLRQLTLEEV